VGRTKGWELGFGLVPFSQITLEIEFRTIHHECMCENSVPKIYPATMAIPFTGEIAEISKIDPVTFIN
jgi:hypothetical protein